MNGSGILSDLAIGVIALIFLIVDGIAILRVRSRIRRCFYAGQMIPLFWIVLTATISVLGNYHEAFLSRALTRRDLSDSWQRWAMVPILAAGLAERIAYIAHEQEGPDNAEAGGRRTDGRADD